MSVLVAYAVIGAGVAWCVYWPAWLLRMIEPETTNAPA